MRNDIVKIETTQLEEVVKNSGLAIIEAEEIKAAYLPFLARLVQIQEQAIKINFETPAMIDETIARELRLSTVKIRTDAEKLKDEQKRVDLLRGKVKQDSYNLIASSCKLAEEVFFNVEKARELAEKKRKEQLKIERAELLASYSSPEMISMYALSEMSDEQFTELYIGLKTAFEVKIENEKKAEAERLAKIEADRIEQERIKAENDRLRKEAEEKEQALAIERENIRKENEERERLAGIERKKQADILAKQKAESDKKEAELRAKAEAERKERERLAKELQDKKDAEENEKRELLKKLEAEKKAKIAEEKKAKLAPDKDKLLHFMQAINDLARPEVRSIEAGEIATNANTYLVQCANYIRDHANKL